MPTKTFPLSKIPTAISLQELHTYSIPVVPAMGRVFRDFARTITKKDEFCAGSMLMQGKLVDNGTVPIAPCAMGHLALQLHDVDYLVKKLRFTVDKISLDNDGTKYYSFKDIDDFQVTTSLVAYFKKLPLELKQQILNGGYYDKEEQTQDDYFQALAVNLTGIITTLNDSYVPKILEWHDMEDFDEHSRPSWDNAPSFSRAQYVKECFKLTAQKIQVECSKSRKARRSSVKVGLQ